jgi:hypothetical protein
MDAGLSWTLMQDAQVVPDFPTFLITELIDIQVGLIDLI